MQLPNTYAARDRRFLAELADKLRLFVTYDEFTDEGENLITVRFDDALLAMAREEADDGISEEEEEGESSSEAEDIGIVHLSLNGEVAHPRRAATKAKQGKQGDGDEPEWQTAIKRVLGQYAKAEVVREITAEEAEEEQEKEIKERMEVWKRDYYKVRLVVLALAILLSSRD